MFDKINIRSYNIRNGVDNMKKDKYDLLIENNGFKLVSAGNFKRVYTKPYKDLGTIEVALTIALCTLMNTGTIVSTIFPKI